MKKKILILLVSSTLLLTSCGNTAVDSAAPTESTPIESTTVVSEENPETQNDLSELEAIGDVKVEENLFSVELTIPADYVGETTQEELDATASEKGYKSITLNADGSATYVMTKDQHKTMMNEMASSINSSLTEMIGSTNYPNITDIKANDDFTEFTVTTKSTELDMNESFSVLAFYMYGGMYHIFNGTTIDNVSVTFVNADTGTVISTSNSADMEK